MYQCAETARIADGVPTDSPNSLHVSVYRLCSRVFIGLPWPMKTAGIELMLPIYLRSQLFPHLLRLPLALSVGP